MGEEVQSAFRSGQKVVFVEGTHFAGKSGVVQFVGDSGRVFVNLTGTAPGPNGRRTKLKGTFAEPEEIRPA